MTAVAPATGSSSAPTEPGVRFMPALPLYGDHSPTSAFFNIPPASLFASLFASSIVSSNSTPPTPQLPPQPPSTPPQPQQASQSIQPTPPRSLSPPPGIYCDLGPAVFERTPRGYTVLRYEGYSFSKISDNRTKTYWRCANRTCRAKVHTNCGRIVYVGREPHIHRPRLPAPSRVRGVNPMTSTYSASASINLTVNKGNLSTNDPSLAAPLDLRPKKEASSVDYSGGEEVVNDAFIEGDSEEGDAKASLPSVDSSVTKRTTEVERQQAELTPSSSPTPSSTSSSSPSSRKATKHVKSKHNKMLPMLAIRNLPRSASEVELLRLLLRANLVSYYDIFVSRGGDDVQQLVEANEEEFAEILRLVDMAAKPLHVRRLQKVLSEWVANPTPFRQPLTPGEMQSLSALANVSQRHNTSYPVTTTPGTGQRSVNAPPSVAKSSASSIDSLPHMGSGDSEVSGVMAPINLSIVSHSAYPTATSSSSSGSPHTNTSSLSRGSPATFFNPSRSSLPDANPKATSRPATSTNEESDTGASASPVNGENTDSNASSFATNLSDSNNHNGLLMLNTESNSQNGLSDDLHSNIIRIVNDLIKREPALLQLSAKTSVQPHGMRASDFEDLAVASALPREAPDFAALVHRFSKVFGRFDTKRKNPDRPLTEYELAVNEASAALSFAVPALLTHRERLCSMAKQVVRELRECSSRTDTISPGTRSSRSKHKPSPVSPPLSTDVKAEVFESDNSAEPIAKSARRTVITPSGEIVFPGSEKPAEKSDKPVASENATSDKASVAMALAKQLGYSDLAVELEHETSPDQ